MVALGLSSTGSRFSATSWTWLAHEAELKLSGTDDRPALFPPFKSTTNPRTEQTQYDSCTKSCCPAKCQEGCSGSKEKTLDRTSIKNERESLCAKKPLKQQNEKGDDRSVTV
jgi:hypothetical protein